MNEGGRRVFVEREGRIEAVPDRSLESRNLTVAIKNIARRVATRSPTCSLCWMRAWKTGRESRRCSRLAVAGPALTIRKFTRRYSLDDLVELGALSTT